jgi:hypothetical protein
MQNPFAETALPLLAAGYSPLPIVLGTKRPALAGWQRLCDAPASLDQIERFAGSPTTFGVGLALGFNGLIAIDIDAEDAAIVAAIREVLPPSVVAKRGRKGRTDFYRNHMSTIRARKLSGPGGMLVEILAYGNQTVIPPTRHPETGQPYRWLGERTLLNTPVAELPMISVDIAHQFTAVLATRLRSAPRLAPAHPPLQQSAIEEQERERQRRYAEAIIAQDLKSLASMAPRSGRNHATFRLICRVGRWTHHGIIPRDRLIAHVLDACERNGLVRDHGPRAVLATIASGLDKSAGDALPDLGPHHG